MFDRKHLTCVVTAAADRWSYYKVYTYVGIASTRGRRSVEVAILLRDTVVIALLGGLIRNQTKVFSVWRSQT